jgi:hypothetical protein
LDKSTNFDAKLRGGGYNTPYWLWRLPGGLLTVAFVWLPWVGVLRRGGEGKREKVKGKS